MGTIGYRPPQNGASNIQRLRAEYEQYHEAIVEAEIQRRMAPPPTKINYGIPAIRAWKIYDDKLWSLTRHCGWHDIVKRNNSKPTFRGGNGFWAVKPNYIDILEGYTLHAIGWVELSGTVVEHTEGWRGEVCVIQKLYVLTDVLGGGQAHRLRNVFARLYQCETYACSLSTFLECYHEHR